MKRIIHVVGNRPQFIKLAFLYEQISCFGDNIKQEIIHTGQHSSPEMSDVFFNELNIPRPDISLIPASTSADLFIGETANSLSSVFSKKDIVVLYGDTNTTFSAALAARRVGAYLAHVEGGIRTADKSMPEEINRVLTDRLSDMIFCCTQKNADTLLEEGYGTKISAKIFVTGDLMYDAYKKRNAADKNPTQKTNYIACTIHRVANITNQASLTEIISALNEINQDLAVVMPVHPHTQKKIKEFDLTPAFETLTALNYSETKKLIAESSYVITDSGGAAREAFFAGKKSLVIMESPFWPEIIDAGCALHTPAKKDSIKSKFKQLENLKTNFGAPIFGDGEAGRKIAELLINIHHSFS